MLSFRLDRKQKKFFKSISNSQVSLLFHSFGIETINTLIHSRKSLGNHTRVQTKMGKVYTRFQTKLGANTLPDLAAHTVYGLYKGVALPPPPRDPVFLQLR